MQFRSWDELKSETPFCGGKWDQRKLKEYLIQSCNLNFNLKIKLYFSQFRKDGDLADLLFEFLRNDDYEGSDCQIGAAYFISKLDKNILKERKALLLKTQENEVFWRRPFQTDDYLKWL